MQNILAGFPDSDKGRLVKVCSILNSTSAIDSQWPAQNVFVTGTPCQLPGLIPRLQSTLRPILPPEMPLEVARAADPSLDAWRGMADFAKTAEFQRVAVTKAEYEEWGGERIKRWWGGNWNSSFTA